jgi:general secretion pathway protein J
MSGRHPGGMKTAFKTEDGFTLLEMLVALVLLSLTAALLTVSLRTGRTALNAVSRIHVTMPIAATQSYLRQAFAQTFAQPRNATANSSTGNFYGTPQSVTFSTSHAPQGQFEGLYRVEIGLVALDQRGTFDLNIAQVLWRPPATDSTPPPLIRRTTQLIGNVASAGFAYYGDMDDNAGASWHNNWSHAVKIPSMVALDVTFAASDPRRWDRLILPIYMAEAAAIVCPPRGRCR